MIARESIEAAIDRLRSRTDKSLEIVFQSHDSWPFGRASASPSLEDGAHNDLVVSVFDSSFNPPTLAHLSIALLDRPGSDDRTAPYDAHLLLLSVTNADKKLKPSDATYVQRVEMMILLARDMLALQPGIQVAVAIIDEPTFVGKCRVIRRTFGKEGNKAPRGLRLWFGIGWDTLLRFFAPRYYGGAEGMSEQLEGFFGRDGSGLLCARRGKSAAEEEKEFLESQEVKKWVDAGKVVMVEIGERATFSSTSIREAIGQGREDWKVMCTSSIAEYILKEGLYRQV